MTPTDPETNRKIQTYLDSGNLEAHIIADMLRIESITTEVRDLRQNTAENFTTMRQAMVENFAALKEEHNRRFDKLENWIVAIVGVSFTSLVALAFMLLQTLIGG